MNSDRDKHSAKDVEHEMEDEAGRMERRLDELGDHVDDAQKKAENARADANVDGYDPLDAAAGDASERTTASDDPTSAVGDPEDADDD
jgi:hypothetical protein